jgi:hypothetical protein
VGDIYVSVTAEQDGLHVLERYAAVASACWSGPVLVARSTSDDRTWFVQFCDDQRRSVYYVGFMVGLDDNDIWCLATVHGYGDDPGGALAWMVHSRAAEELGSQVRALDGAAAEAMLYEITSGERPVRHHMVNWP